MGSKKLIKTGTKRRSEALKSTENLATKTGMKKIQNGAVKKNGRTATKVKEDESALLTLDDVKKPSLSNELRAPHRTTALTAPSKCLTDPRLILEFSKDQFAQLQEFFHLHPQGAEERLTCQNQTSRKKKGENGMDKLQMIRRIEQALQENIQEISTYEFFGFNDSLAPNTISEVACSISLVGFDKDKMLKKETLFSGNLPCNVKRNEQKSKIVFHPVAECFQGSATDGFLVAEVTVEYNPTGSHSQGNRGTGGRKRTSMTNTVTVGLGKRTFYGSRKIYERNHSDGSLDIKFCDSAIHMSADTAMPSNWDSNHNSVSGLAAKLETDSKCFTLPLIAFELTDQHCELDWDEIDKRVQWREERKAVESGKNLRYIIYKEPSSSSSCSSTSSDSSKENEERAEKIPDAIDVKMEVDEEFKTEVELTQMVENRCPFCLNDENSSEDLMHHLATRYPFDFRKMDGNIIQVGSLNSLGNLSQSSSDSSGFRADLEKPKVITTDKVGILRNELLPFTMPDITPNPYPTYIQDCVLVEHKSTWKEIFTMREMSEYIDNTLDEMTFMTWINQHTLKTREPLQGQHQKAVFMKFLADELLVQKPLPWEKCCTMLAAMAHSLLRSNAIPIEVFNDITDYVFDLKP